MKPEFIIEQHGKKYVLYQGLLDEAHKRGLRSIEVELLQIPNSANDFTAISKATAVFADGFTDESGLVAFTELGDASPANVTKNIAPHIIRMSATRAKARALRDAVNIGVTAFEELGEDLPDEPVPASPAGRRYSGTQLQSAAKAASKAKGVLNGKQDKKPSDEEEHGLVIDRITVLYDTLAEEIRPPVEDVMIHAGKSTRHATHVLHRLEELQKENEHT